MERFDPQKYTDDETERITLRVSHKVKEDLARLAQQQNLSLNKLLIRCINYALNNMKEDK